MPEYWQFPTVSMGLRSNFWDLSSAYHEVFRKRGLLDETKRKVWVFCGDGEMDEPESKGA